MAKPSSAVVPLLLTGVILLGLYVGSYACLVKSEASTLDPLRQPRVARYRVGGAAAERFFFPAEQVDRKLRQDYWTTPDCLRGGEW
jgi:hypothetical protein